MRVVTPNEVATAFGSLSTSVPRVVVSGNLATPRTLLDLFDANVESYRLFTLNAHGPVPIRTDVAHETPFVGPAVREVEHLDYLPTRLSMVPTLFATWRPPDVVLLNCAPPRDGAISLGIEVNILPAAIEEARRRGALVVAQLNPSVPFIDGDGVIAEDLIDLGVEVDEPIGTLHSTAPDERCEMVAEHAARLVADGATLQIGIGQVPDAVLSALRDRRGLRIWSETISDGVLALERAGALDRSTPIVASFLLGTEELYEWAATSGRVRLARTEVTNDPARIAANPQMFSLNTAFEVDLYAQSNASYRRGVIYSGFGGQSDFTVGAMHSAGGHAVIALRSWHEPTSTSTIIPVATTPVTSFQHSAVVTEQGIATIFGHSQRAQARLLISQAAHPDARAQLREHARERGLLD